MGMFDYKNYSSAQSVELLETAYKLATYANVEIFSGVSSLLQPVANAVLNTGLYSSTVNLQLPAGWRELTPAELSLPSSAVDAAGQYIIESPLTGTTFTGEQAKILGQYDAQGKLVRVAMSYTGTNSPVDIPDYFQLNSGELAPKLDPLLTALKNFAIKNGLTAKDTIITGYSLGGGIANLAAEYRNTLAGGFFADANFVGVASPLIYDDASVVLNYGYENDVVHRAVGSGDTLAGALTAAGTLLTNPDKKYSSSIDNMVLFDDMYASPLWETPFSIVNIPVAWYAHIDGVLSDAQSRIAANPFYDLMEKDSTTIVANLSALSRGTTWVTDKAAATSDHFGTSAFVIGSKDDDLLQGGTGNDFIFGGQGNDKIRTGGGSDRVDGGTGTNELRLNGTAADWNAYSLSDGTLFMDAKNKINLVEAERIQGVSFENDLLSQTYAYTVGSTGLTDKRAGLLSSLIHTNVAYQKATEGTIGNDNLSGAVVFGKDGNDTLTAIASGSLLHGGEGNDKLVGGIGSDRLFGAEGSDTLIGGKGADALDGGLGNDIYQFGRGDGKDVVRESGGSDQIVFSGNVAANQLWFTKSGDNLVIKVIGTTDEMTIEKWYSNDSFKVESIKSSDGKTLTSAHVDALVSAMSSFSVPAAGQTILPANYQSSLNVALAANWA